MILNSPEMEYTPLQMTDDELRSNKYCRECQKVTETYWELLYCDKNPEGLDSELIEHGNEIEGTTTCEDDYCNPNEETIDKQNITIQYITTHSVNERCSKCHQYYEAMG